MQGVINWINQNNGFIMALLTAVYVGATIAYVLSTRKLVSGQQLLLAMTATVEAARSRPRVWFSIRAQTTQSGVLMFASLKNHGHGPAFSIRTTLDPPLLKIGLNQAIETVFTTYVTSFLPPGAEELDALDSGLGFEHLNGNKVLNVGITYFDGTGTKFDERYKLSLIEVHARNYFRIV